MAPLWILVYGTSYSESRFPNLWGFRQVRLVKD